MSIYVCSDIHGLKRRYDHMIQQIHDTDHLYVIGDVIDRGAHGITILRDLLKRSNVTLMMGNHEYMMLQYYLAKQGKIEQREEQEAALLNWRFNHCESTRKEFEALMVEEQEALLEKISAFPIAICDLMVNDRCYYLVHGCPSTLLLSGSYDLKKAKEKGIPAEYLLWNRIDPSQQYLPDRCVITGHTPTLFFQKDHPYKVWIQGDDIFQTHLMDIDCGCAADNEDSRIALVCLDDLQIQYY